jgi:ATP/maltotriose-dependent transcriptional regulator MalT
VTVVSGPPGSGKTVLLRSGISRAGLSDRAAWLRVLGVAPRLTEPLSGSELRVLRYLPANLTGPEIAAELYVSHNTVKTHVRSLYMKLGTHRRAEAVGSPATRACSHPAARSPR